MVTIKYKERHHRELLLLFSFDYCHLKYWKYLWGQEYFLLADVKLTFVVRALWFVLEIIMAKNENNSHAFIRKMVENIKQTKDAQAPSDSKTNEVQL